MDLEEKLNYYYSRLLFFGDVHMNSHVVKIANLSYDEMKDYVLKIINEGGLEFLKSKMEAETNFTTLRTTLGLLLPFDKEYVIQFYREMHKNNIKEFDYFTFSFINEITSEEYVERIRNNYIILTKKKKIKVENQDLKRALMLN